MPRKMKVVDVVDSDNNEAVGESVQQPELVQEMLSFSNLPPHVR